MAGAPGFSSGRGMRLEKVVGLGLGGGCGCADVNPANQAEVAYSVGCVVVLWCAASAKQRNYMRMAKPVACLRFSPDGKFLAVGERGHNPAVTVWDVRSHVRVAELKAHKFGVACVRFSPDGMKLVSAGFDPDGKLALWDWASASLLADTTLDTSIKAVDFTQDGCELITVGTKHLRYWALAKAGPRESDALTTSASEREWSLHEHRATLLPEYKDATFTDVICGTGDFAGSTFLSTSCGSLVCLAPDRTMEKWVYLEVDSVLSLSLCKGRIACGCSNGVVRVFDAKSFEFVETLPMPQSATGAEQVEPKAAKKDASGRAEPASAFPDAVAVRWGLRGEQVVAIYANHSLFVWDLSDLTSIVRVNACFAHPTGVTGVVAMPSPPRTKGSAPYPDAMFLTCADDRKLRFWKLSGGRKKRLASPAQWDSPISHELVREIDLGELAPEVAEGIKCIAVSRDGSRIAVGDKQGGIFLYDLIEDKLVLSAPQSHSGEVLTIEFSASIPACTEDGTHGVAPDKAHARGIEYLASGGRDRQVLLFDMGKLDQRPKVLKDHSASVTSIKFSADGRRLLSAGGDKTIVLSSLERQSDDVLITRLQSIALPQGTVNAMDIDASNKYFCTAGQDKKISIWSLTNGKPIRSYKPEGEGGELTTVKLDPAGMLCATGLHDKSIRLLDFYSGECLARSAGHSEPITGLTFSNDCKRVVSVSWDGCMFVWRLAPEITASMKERLREIELHSTFRKEQEALKHLGGAAVDENESGNGINVAPELLFDSSRLPTWARTKAALPGDAAVDKSTSSTVSHESDEDFENEKGPDVKQTAAGDRVATGDQSDSNFLGPPSPTPTPTPAARKQVVDQMSDAGSVASSVLTAPRSPPPKPGKARSLVEERKALRLKEKKEDSDRAVRQMRDQLKSLSLLSATIGSSRAAAGGPISEPTEEGQAVEVADNADDAAVASYVPLVAPAVPPVPGNVPMPPQSDAPPTVVDEDDLVGMLSPLVTPVPPGASSRSRTRERSNLRVNSSALRGQGGLGVVVEQHSMDDALPALLTPLETPANLLPARSGPGFTPGATLQTPQDAQAACQFALSQMQVALATSAEVLRQVGELDENLALSMGRNAKSGDRFTQGVLETTSRSVKDIMNGFKAQMSGMVGVEGLDTLATCGPSGVGQNALDRSMFMGPASATSQAPGVEQMQVMMSQLGNITNLLEKLTEAKGGRQAATQVADAHG